MPVRKEIEAMQTHEFYQEAIQRIGAKKVAAAHGVTTKHAYRLAQPEEADGVRTDLDRFVQFLDVLGAHPHARPLLKTMHVWMEAQFARVLGSDGSSSSVPLSGLDYAREGGSAMKELAEFIATLDDPAQMDMERALREGAEALNAVEGLFRRVLAASQQRHDPRPAVRRVQ